MGLLTESSSAYIGQYFSHFVVGIYDGTLLVYTVHTQIKWQAVNNISDTIKSLELSDRHLISDVHSPGCSWCSKAEQLHCEKKNTH